MEIEINCWLPIQQLLKIMIINCKMQSIKIQRKFHQIVQTKISTQQSLNVLHVTQQRISILMLKP